ncbi:MAG: class I SAM-dependent methyltransferase [Nitrospirae bacterium]|nr:class I SAM-dependent methyltransferase [Nitrospirota bacterium]
MKRKQFRTFLGLQRNRWIYRLFYLRGVRNTPWHDEEPMPTLLKWHRERKLPRRGRALDLGCGGGTNTLWLARQGFDATGIDMTPRAIEYARDKAEKANVKVRWILGDVLASEVGDGFDVILDRGCYHSLPEEAREVYAERIRSWLRPRGAYVLGCFVWSGFGEWSRPCPAPRVPEGEPVRLFVPPFVLRDREELRDRVGAVKTRFAIHLFTR